MVLTRHVGRLHRVHTSCHLRSGRLVHVVHTPPSKINQLQAENRNLADELSLRDGKVHTKSLARHHAEERSKQLEGELFNARAEENVLCHKTTSLSRKVERLTKKMARSDREVKQSIDD